MIREIVGAAWRGWQRTSASGQEWMFGEKRATYGLAAMRICLGLAILGSLASNFGLRHYVWGGGVRWALPFTEVDEFGFPFTSVFGTDDSPGVFTAKYILLAAVTVLFTVGWRTRVVTPVLLIMLTSLMRLDQLAIDAGDNLIRIMLVFLCFADISKRWSLDTRRRANGPDGLGRIPPWVGMVFNNVALLAVAAQIFIVYLTSGLSKVQGELWQEGVGMYYPLRIGLYEAFPGLNEIVYTNGLVVMLGSYATVFVQVFFPLLLIRRGTRVLALLTVGLMHLGIAVTMALPWFSLAILAADAIFVRDSTYVAAARLVRRRRSGNIHAGDRGKNLAASSAGDFPTITGGASDSMGGRRPG